MCVSSNPVGTATRLADVVLVAITERKGAVPLQWPRSAAADSQRGDLGVQQELYAVHPDVDFRPADMAWDAVHLRVRLLGSRTDHQFFSLLR